MVNESLCKIVCHYFVVLIHEMSEIGMEPQFWSGSRSMGRHNLSRIISAE